MATGKPNTLGISEVRSGHLHRPPFICDMQYAQHIQ
jgi:hypothetical protein